MKLIPLDALLAEIEKLYQQHSSKEYIDKAGCVLDKLEDIINSLKVKEVDLEDSIKESLAQKYIDYTFKRHNIDPESKEGQLIYHAYMHGMNQCLTQLKAQKGE